MSNIQSIFLTRNTIKNSFKYEKKKKNSLCRKSYWVIYTDLFDFRHKEYFFISLKKRTPRYIFAIYRSGVHTSVYEIRI